MGYTGPVDIRIKVHYPWCAPVKHETGDWIDLCIADDIYFDKQFYDDYKPKYIKTHFIFSYINISLGVSMKLPDGYEAIIASRSSTYNKYGIIMAGGIGVIDNSYCGEDDIWHYPAIFTKPILSIIPKGERLCQFRIQEKQPEVNFIFVESLPYTNRGGFGTTG